jgi:NADH-quinone oxidoreductase subunit G
VFLRLRKAALKTGTKVFAVAPYVTAGLAKMKGTLLAASPATEVAALQSAAGHLSATSVILVGERAATTPGLLTAVVELAASSGAKLAWVPRRAGDRGAVDAGLLPIGGRNTSEIIAATGSDIQGLLIAGVDAHDVDGDFEAALERAQFVVSLETRHCAVTERADVVLPVAVVAEKSGTFTNWEGRERSFNTVVPTPGVLSDAAVLGELAREFDMDLALSDVRATLDNPALVAGTASSPAVGAQQAVLTTWRHLLDKGTLQDGEPYLAATARVAVIRVSPATAATLKLVDGETATVSFGEKSASAPVIVTGGMADGVVWLPANSEGAALNLPSGTVVNVNSGGVA